MRGSAKKRLLIVDDNVDLAENLKEILEDDGVEVSLARAGAEALGQLRGQRFDLVLTDMRMPGLSGLDVLRAVRREFPGVPVAIMTAYSNDRLLDEARAHGALTILLKPVPFERLLDLVNLALEPKQTVLLIEDETALRIDLAEVLAGRRALTFSCGTMEEARRCLSAVAPDIAVIDRHLPDGDALPLALELSRLGRPGRMGVLLISGATMAEGELVDLRANGSMDWLAKPFGPELLLDRLGRLHTPLPN